MSPKTTKPMTDLEFAIARNRANRAAKKATEEQTRRRRLFGDLPEDVQFIGCALLDDAARAGEQNIIYTDTRDADGWQSPVKASGGVS